MNRGLEISYMSIDELTPLDRCLIKMQRIANERTKRKYSYDFIYSEFYTFVSRGYNIKQSLDFIKMIIRGQITTLDILMMTEPSINTFKIDISRLEDDKMFFDKSVNTLDDNVKLKKRHKSDRNFYRGIR